MHCKNLNDRRVVAACSVLACLVCMLAGCSRQLYRMRADKEVKYLVTQKSNDPRWDYLNYTIGMDPRARYFDPTNPDCPPMPFDDPASHRYMHCIDGKKGYPCWHMSGNWYGLENPQWKELLARYNEIMPDGAIRLTMNGSVCLAQIHSTDYRTQVESIYLAALDVSTERYRFDVQFFGDSTSVFNHTNSPGGGESNTLTQNTTFQVKKHFSTGADLLVGFANSFVWQFAGTNSTTPSSLFNFSFIQPLLRGGGRVVALEQLTIVERSLLASLRVFQRYRQGFYTNITVGNSFVGSVQSVTSVRRGGLTGGTGLTGFTGQGTGGFGGLGAVFSIGSAGGGAGAGGGGTGFVQGNAGAVGGFVGLVQQVQNVRNSQNNLDAQVRTLGLLEANLEAGLIDIVQVDSFRQNMESQRATLLAADVQLQSMLDSFKAGNLNLPPDLNVDIDDSMLRQFEFLDPKTTAVQHMIDDYVNVVGDLPAEPERQDLRSALDVLAKLRQRLSEQFKSAHADMARLDAVAPQRKKTTSAKRAAQFDDELVKLAESLADVENRFDQTEGTLQSLEQSFGTESGAKVTDDIVSLATGLSGLTQEISLVKARARLETVTTPLINLDSERALNIARAYRLDWMNVRSSLVDQWRLIAYNANFLRAGLNLTFNGGLGTLNNNGVATFNAQNSNLSVGVAFDSPFTRRVERNNYRSVLISYQQVRRSTYQYEDGVNIMLRNLLRTLKQLEINLEIQRRAVTIAIRRVDKTREDLNKPPAPVQPGQQIESLGPTVAQNLIFALNDLQTAQNAFVSVVLNHYENRMLLYRELGVMELDDCGIWIDKPLDDVDWLTAEQCPLPPPVPIEWLQEAGVDPQDLHDYAVEHENELPGGQVEYQANSREEAIEAPLPPRGQEQIQAGPRKPLRGLKSVDGAPATLRRPLGDRPTAEKAAQWAPAGRQRMTGTTRSSDPTESN